MPAAVPAIQSVATATRSSPDSRQASTTSRATTVRIDTTSKMRTAAISLPVTFSSRPRATGPTGGKCVSGRPWRTNPSPANRCWPASR